MTNTQGMMSGMMVAVMLPCVLLEYYYTRERVTEESRKEKQRRKDTEESGAELDIRRVQNVKERSGQMPRVQAARGDCSERQWGQNAEKKDRLPKLSVTEQLKLC